MKENDILKVSPIPYIYRWGKGHIIEFWVKYSPEKPNSKAGFIGMMKEKIIGILPDPMPIVICEEIDKRVRPLITTNKWIYFTVYDTEIYVNGELK